MKNFILLLLFILPFTSNAIKVRAEFDCIVASKTDAGFFIPFTKKKDRKNFNFIKSSISVITVLTRNGRSIDIDLDSLRSQGIEKISLFKDEGVVRFKTYIPHKMESKNFLNAKSASKSTYVMFSKNILKYYAVFASSNGRLVEVREAKEMEVETLLIVNRFTGETHQYNPDGKGVSVEWTVANKAEVRVIDGGPQPVLALQ